MNADFDASKRTFEEALTNFRRACERFGQMREYPIVVDIRGVLSIECFRDSCGLVDERLKFEVRLPVGIASALLLINQGEAPSEAPA